MISSGLCLRDIPFLLRGPDHDSRWATQKGADQIAAEAFVGPGVTIGDGAVLGARAALFSDAEPWSIYRGNPAVLIKQRRLRQA
jgi:serine acetyltransferase